MDFLSFQARFHTGRSSGGCLFLFLFRRLYINGFAVHIQPVVILLEPDGVAQKPLTMRAKEFGAKGTAGKNPVAFLLGFPAALVAKATQLLRVYLWAVDIAYDVGLETEPVIKFLAARQGELLNQCG